MWAVPNSSLQKLSKLRQQPFFRTLMKVIGLWFFFQSYNLTLKAMCSRKCATPLVFSVSYRLPASIQIPTVAVGAPVSSEATRTAFDRVVTRVSGTLSNDWENVVRVRWVSWRLWFCRAVWWREPARRSAVKKGIFLSDSHQPDNCQVLMGCTGEPHQHTRLFRTLTWNCDQQKPDFAVPSHECKHITDVVCSEMKAVVEGLLLSSAGNMESGCLRWSMNVTDVYESKA